MKPKTKKFLSNFFFGLFSNDHAMEGAKSNPWWVCLIIGLISVVIPVIPITVTQARSYGASFLDGYTHRFDQNIANLTVDMLENDQEFIVQDKLLVYYENGSKVNVNTDNDTTPVTTYINSKTGQYELMVYYTLREKKDLNTYITSFAERTYKGGTTEVPGDDYEGNLYIPSFVVLHKGGIYTRLYKENSVDVGNGTYTAYATDWKHFEEGFKLIQSALPKDKTLAQVDLNNTEDVQDIFTNWKGYYNKAYLNQKAYNTWMTSLLFLGIYAAVVFIMGLLVFLMTRGKNNMFNYMKFIDAEKIVWWASLSPAILSAVLGLFLANFAQMLFIILMGLRVMWISMKQLRPQY